MVQDVLSLNWDLFEEINGPAGHQSLLDPMMIFSADRLIFLLPLLLLVLWFALARWSPFVRHDSQADTARMAGHMIVLSAVVAVVVALGLNIVLGHLLFEPRPFISHPSIVHRLIPHAADASFPSDHSAAAFAMATILVYAGLALARRRTAGGLALFLGLVGVLAAVTIAFARVYTGVHYPGDVIGGAICGIIGGVIALLLRPLLMLLLAPVVRLLGQVGLA